MWNTHYKCTGIVPLEIFEVPTPQAENGKTYTCNMVHSNQCNTQQEEGKRGNIKTITILANLFNLLLLNLKATQICT